MLILAMSVLALTTQGAAQMPESLLPDGRYVEDMADSDACTSEGQRYFSLMPGAADDLDDPGRIVADFGTGRIDMPLSMTSMYPRELAEGEIQGVGLIQARNSDNLRLGITLLLHADRRYMVARVSLTPQGGELQDIIRIVDDPLPHGIAPDGSALEPFVYCGPN